MMINISFYTLVLTILFSILTVMHAEEPANPCQTGPDDIVADMCTDNSAEEEAPEGSDSVLLRITKQQNNCICHVSLHNNATNYTIYMSKYEGHSNAAPEQQNCGLAVDVAYVDTSDTIRSLPPIECTSGTSRRSIALGASKLKLKSRIIDGDFTRGYCIQLSRDQPIYNCSMNEDQVDMAGTDGDWIQTSGEQHTSFDKCKQYCLQTEVCVAVHYDSNYCFVYNQTTKLLLKDNSTYSQKDCVDTQKLKIMCYPPESTTQTSLGTTTEDNLSTKTFIAKDKSSDLYVYLGAAAGGVLMILLIVCIIMCIRKRSNQTSLKESNNYSTKQFSSDSKDSDNDYDGLKDNILYVSSEQNYILDDGNYNTVDLEQTRKINQRINSDGDYSTVDGKVGTIGSNSDSSLSKSKPVSKPKPQTNANVSFKRGSDEETIHLSTIENSNNEYAVVDKGRNSDAVKPINPVLGNDTEYAVVDKVRKSSNNN